ncbi:MAG: fimbrillin family protein [Bacteroidaceae bacterium]|nr:fimbrillin family protein [Bacteroidaceae bacterium]
MRLIRPIRLILLGGLLLMAACTQEERMPDIPAEAVAIAFDCHTALDEGETRTVNGKPGYTTSENGNLYYMGFGVFAREEGATEYNFMWNQAVEYVFLADITKEDFDLYDGYWTYSPIKYWPYKYNNVEQKNVPKTLYFSAYAPYVVKPEGLDPGTTGITGMSSNTEQPYIDYTLSDDLDETVDLLWCYQEVNEVQSVQLRMHHALARVSVGVTLSDANTYKTADTKVLISQITLSGTVARTGRLDLTDANTDEKGIYPTWTVQTTDTHTRVVNILNSDDPASYGIIARDIRYIDDLPYKWQPDGLQKDYEGKGVPANALITRDIHKAYIYFIPYTSPSPLTCTVYYTLMDDSGNVHKGHSTAEVPLSSIANPLKGNRTYQLNLIIDPEVSG